MSDRKRTDSGGKRKSPAAGFGSACLAGFLLLISVFLCAAGGMTTQAATKTKVLTVSLKNGNGTLTNTLYAQKKSGDYTFSWSKDKLDLFTTGTDQKAEVSVKVNSTSIVVEDTLDYDTALNFSNLKKETFEDVLEGVHQSWSVSFTYNMPNGDTSYYRGSLKCYSKDISTEVESMTVSVSSKGFHPSSGNYLRIKAVIPDSNVSVRIRVYNSKGKYVFSKKVNPDENGFVDYQWNGKASKKNQAGAASGKYVKSGTYKVEVCASYKYGSKTWSGTKSKKVKVSSKAASGSKGLSAAKTIPILTGDAETDYLAEQACKKAGVTSKMSDDEKVKKIYHWMTKNFTHGFISGSSKKYYSLSKLSSKVKSYKKKMDKQYASGSVIYNYAWPVTDYLVYRRGVCDNQAAVFKVLCNHVGVEAGICGGYYLNRSGSKSSHAWNYAIVDGKTYYYDVDVEIQNYGKGQGDYYWYKKTKSQAKKNHQFETID